VIVKSSHWRWWLIAVLAVLAVPLGGAAAVVTPRAPMLVQAPIQAPVEAPIVVPDASSSDEAWRAWLAAEITKAVEAQDAALLAGDENGFLSIAEPGNEKLRADLTRRYSNLRALGPGVWRTVMIPNLSRVDFDVSVSLGVAYCFGPPTCQPAAVVNPSGWVVDHGHVFLESLGTDTSVGPRPWEVTDLVVRTGDRVILAAPKSLERRLAEIDVADRGAKVADQFAIWSDPPAKYVIFFADDQAWSTWYGGVETEWAAAVTELVGASVSEVVVNSKRVSKSYANEVFPHELTHVTSLLGHPARTQQTSWWLEEGLAEYASVLGKDVAAYTDFRYLRPYIRQVWKGDPAVEPPTDTEAPDLVGAKYALGFLSVRAIATTYGQDKLIDFFGRVVHQGETLESAANAALGVPWSTVKQKCDDLVRRTIR
jgi:hypothetical protein